MREETRLSPKMNVLPRGVRASEEPSERSTSNTFVDEKIRSAIINLLVLSNKIAGVKDLLEEALEIILSLDFLQVENRGAIFLLDNEKKTLSLISRRNFTEEQAGLCREIPLGACLCGRVGLCGVEEINGAVDDAFHLPGHRHTHYSAPLSIGSWTFGVLCLALPDGKSLDKQELDFLRMAVEILSTSLQRRFYEEELVENQLKLEGRLKEAVLEGKRATVRYRSIFQHSLAGIYQTTVDTGRVRVCNPAFARTLGYASPEALVEEVSDVAMQIYANPEDRRRLIDALRQGPVNDFTTRFVRRDGRVIWVSFSCMLQVDGRGEEFVEGHLLDITDRVQAVKLQKIKALGALARGIGHDFNNLLTVLIGAIDLAAIDVAAGASEKVASALKIMKKTAARAAELVRQLQMYARGEEPVTRSVRIDEVVRQTVAALGLGRQVECTIECDPLALVECDPVQISRVLQNTVQNSVQAMPHGGSITITGSRTMVAQSEIAALAPGPYFLLQVTDTGEGIEERRLATVFDPYVSTRGKGHGLGLSIVQGIVAGHHGHVAVASQPGRGTTFSIYLPL